MCAVLMSLRAGQTTPSAKSQGGHGPLLVAFLRRVAQTSVTQVKRDMVESDARIGSAKMIKLIWYRAPNWDNKSFFASDLEAAFHMYQEHQ